MHKGKLSSYISLIIALLGILTAAVLVMSFTGLKNAPGDFLKICFSFSSFYIPVYLFTAASLAFRDKFRLSSVLLLILSIFPFVTSALFFKVFLEPGDSEAGRIISGLFGRTQGAFIIFLLFLAEILFIYVLSIRMSDRYAEKETEEPAEVKPSVYADGPDRINTADNTDTSEAPEEPGKKPYSRLDLSSIKRPGGSIRKDDTVPESPVPGEMEEEFNEDPEVQDEEQPVPSGNTSVKESLRERLSGVFQKAETRNDEAADVSSVHSMDAPEQIGEIEALEEYTEESREEEAAGKILPDLPPLRDLRSRSRFSDSVSGIYSSEDDLEDEEPESDNENDFHDEAPEDSPGYEDEEEEFFDDGPDEIDDADDSREDEDFFDDDPESDVFAELGDGHLVDAASVSAPEADKKPAAKSGRASYKNYNIPADNLLNDYADGKYWVIDDDTRRAAEVLKETLEEFKISAEVTGIQKGPVITMFEILPAPGVKLSKIANLSDNIAMRLAASRVRIVAPIPGKHAVGIEIPNKERAKVSFKEMLQDDKFVDSKTEIPIALGKDITGNTQIIDLVQTPHLLIAGATGSGKSVCVNSIICSILYKRTPDEVRLLLIDPKIVELKLYNDIPHLMTPVITEPKRAFQALQYCIYEMEQRYSMLDTMGVRDIRSYNRKIVKNRIAMKKLPYIVVVVDEFADLIATSGKELESILARLAAMARAVGIHLVLATQRPSIDVITGLIKANIPSRIAFMVSNKIDSRIILDTAGADKLLGQGDMLFSSAWDPALTRIQGAFLSEAEVESVTDHVRTLGEPDYLDEDIFYDDDDDPADAGDYTTNDPLMDKAVEIVVAAGKASASYLQRRLQIGYNRAARLVEEMEARGIVGPQNGSKPREIIHVPDMNREG